jgi:hypothetical protein
MTLELNDREEGVVLAALEQFRSLKHESIIGNEVARKAFKSLNQYDLLAPQHALMHTLTLMSRITKKPVEHFANPNPSQQPQPKTHEPTEQH